MTDREIKEHQLTMKFLSGLLSLICIVSMSITLYGLYLSFSG